MATLIHDPRPLRAWSAPNPNGSGFPGPATDPRLQYAPPASRPSAITAPVPTYDSFPALPPHNDFEMNRETLIKVLDHFSATLQRYFDPGQGMRFVVHGGACMLLHSGLHALSLQQQSSSSSPSMVARTKTRDVDYIHRGFLVEYGQNRLPDAAERLKCCIQETARRFNLGADWMNSDADIALPMAHE